MLHCCVMMITRYVENKIQEKSILHHPFYDEWSRGALTKEQLVGYAKEYYFLVRHIPKIVLNIYNQAPDKLRPFIERILREESEHVELWERFANSLEISTTDLLHYIPHKKVQDAVTELLKMSQRSFDEAVTLIYTFELELPKVSETKKEGLIEFYGLSSDDALIYFNEHLHEENHLKVWRNYLNNVVKEKRSDLEQITNTTLACQHQVLDGVLENYHCAVI